MKTPPRLKWRPSKSRLYGFPAIELAYLGLPVEKEITLSSKYGDIWAVNESTGSLVCKSKKIAFKVKQVLGIDTKEGGNKDDETVLVFPSDLGPVIARLMKVPKSRPRQVFYATNF